MNEITVTVPIKVYENMKKTIEVNHVKNFINKEYSDITKNIYTVVANQKEVKNYFGQELDGDYSTLKENIRLREVLQDISETPITRGISAVEFNLQSVVEQARETLIEIEKMKAPKKEKLEGLRPNFIFFDEME